ncbi:HAD family hydrolase [Baekduia sp. Peel2402]|uniref:HAD family hydrolase n=1 Tax=Baekduia sp. Peel2402 TaxID=3458296 RepID=UPI00403EC707
MSTALLIDFGGVLTTSVHEAFRAFAREISDDESLVLRLLATDAESNALLVGNENGSLTDEEFEAGFAARLAAHGVTVAPEGLLARMQAGFGPDPEMVDGLAALRAHGVPVALVTNQFGRDCYRGFDLPALADEVVVSTELGVRKPSRKIYAVACERLGVEPSQAVMVDDIQHNLDGAAKLGIAGVLHTSAADTLAELDTRFGLR